MSRWSIALAMLFALIGAADAEPPADRPMPVSSRQPFIIQTVGDAEAALARVPDRLKDKLYGEKIVLLDSPAYSDLVEGLVIFAQPQGRTFDLLAQSARHVEFRPEVKTIQTVERFDGGSVDEHRLRILFLDFGYRLRNMIDRPHAWIRWELDAEFDNDLDRLTGSWQIFPLEEERSLGLFKTAVKVGGGLPDFVQKQVTRKNVPATLSRCRQWIDSGGKWRP